jgi:NADPH:quinone reductase-like Zn-dependent oxidoreductase
MSATASTDAADGDAAEAARPFAGAESMQAVTQAGYGEADNVLRLERIPKPKIGDNEVLVHVHAAGVDRGVWHLMAGLPYLLRLIIPELGLRAPKTPIRGSDVAGVVEAVGEDVTRFRPGDEVFGVAKGSYAEYAGALESKLAHKPANVTFEEAAVVPISGLTGLQAVRDGGNVQSGQKVLILGASGGVGTFAVQIAKSFGAEVTGVCSTTKVDLVRSLGADHVVDYTREDFANGEQHYDVIIDTGGHSSLSQLRRALTPKGTVVIVGAETDQRWFGGFDRSIRAMLLSRFVSQELVAFVNSENHEDLIVLQELIEAGEIKPVLDRTFPLSEAPKALDYLRQGRARGKVAITVE